MAHTKSQRNAETACAGRCPWGISKRGYRRAKNRACTGCRREEKTMWTKTSAMPAGPATVPQEK